MWNRATVAVVLALYAWSMMLLELYLRGAGSVDNALQHFRRMTMGRAVIGLGAAAVIAAAVLAVLGRNHRRPAVIASVLVLGWIACLAAIWPI